MPDQGKQPSRKCYGWAFALGHLHLRDMTGLSYPALGHLFGLDHSTAIHAYKKIKRNRSANARLNNDIQQITDSIQRE